MTSANQSPFIERRRQPFITEAYSTKFQKIKLERSIPYFKKALNEIRGATSSEELLDQKAGYNAIADDLTDLLHLRYTAGESITQLRSELDEVVAAWEDYAKALRRFKEDESWPAFWFPYRVDYTKYLLLVGLVILFRREDLLPRVGALCPNYRGHDTLFDELMNAFVALQVESDEYAWFHDVPYETVVDTIDSQDPKERSELMGQAVEDWYPANAGQPFHGTHKDVDDTGEGGYVGYWCFELAALCFIKGIDDSAFRDHLTYPKDLVDFARSKGLLPGANTATHSILSAQPGEAVPRAGRWQTPAMLENRSLTLAAGETLPYAKTDKAGNAVVWFWKAEK